MKKFLPLIIGLFLVGCVGEELVWTGTYSFPGGEWCGREKITFTPDSSFLEGAKGCKGVLSLRYAEDASVESLPLVMETESAASGAYRSDTVTLRLLPASRRSGNEARMGVFESVDTIPLMVAPEPGWTVTFHPATGDVEIRGIYSMTLEIIGK